MSERELQPQTWNFYPRSPCGERLVRLAKLCEVALFLSTLSLRRATIRFQISQSGITNFYPRSPCGERQCWKRHKCRKSQKFLSTLSLRRATDKVLEAVSRNGISIHALLAESDNGRKSLNALAEYFYPRSPCGERPNFHRVRYNTVDISIHALLAESDDTDWEIVNVPKISIHALLAESDRHLSQLIPLHSYFYPRSPCGERLGSP